MLAGATTGAVTGPLEEFVRTHRRVSPTVGTRTVVATVVVVATDTVAEATMVAVAEATTDASRRTRPNPLQDEESSGPFSTTS